MAKMPKDKLLFYIIATVALVAVFLVIIDLSNRTIESVQLIEDSYKKSKIEQSEEKEEEKIIIPSPEDLDLNNNFTEEVARPVRISEMESGTNQRFFEILAINDQFQPKEIMVYQNEIVNIKVRAEDKDYDLIIPDLGMKIDIKQDDNQTLEFQARETGNFLFYCPSCPAETTNGVIKVY
jgi:heme/copper-type cytochrome/quinol oxidase subunit 2